MNKETTMVLYSALVLGMDPNASTPNQEPLKVTILASTTSDLPAFVALPGFVPAVPQPLAPSQSAPAMLTTPETAKVPARRDPNTFLGELLVHLIAGIILMTVAALGAHVVLSWH